MAMKQLCVACRLEVLDSCSQLELLCHPPPLAGAVHVLLWHSLDCLPIIHLIISKQPTATYSGPGSSRKASEEELTFRGMPYVGHQNLPVRIADNVWIADTAAAGSIKGREPFGKQYWSGCLMMCVRPLAFLIGSCVMRLQVQGISCRNLSKDCGCDLTLLAHISAAAITRYVPLMKMRTISSTI
jgi:hypothetical protein